ncbi:Mutant gag-pol polyprotein [Melia azedarach]|uniref:Mutant gag-pol polyprotein n=1 Tax=Melia azedarach TaxID=155640 RepID=A0ACC1XC29_MELAZ|nr:Mutant gag-pol polyprotein [Melia azedarach]
MSIGEEPQEVDMKMFIKAVNEQFRKLNTRLDDMQSPFTSKNTRRRVLEEEEEDDSDLEESSSKRGKKIVSKRDNNLGSIKMKIPTFQGKNDPELYLEWERKVEHVFDCHNYSEEKKVKLAAVEFIDYASIWWDQLVINRRRNGEKPIRSWEEMKLIMRKKFIPNHYYRDLHRKLQGLVQGSISVEDYYKEMEIAMIRANIEEDREVTMARFISGLNKEVADVVDLQHYVEMEELLHKSIKVEKQLKSKEFRCGSASNSSWKSKWKDNKVTSKTNEEAKQNDSIVISKSKIETEISSKLHEVKCFRCQGLGHIASQCPNKIVMMVLENGEIESASSSEDEMPPLADYSNIEIEEPVHSDLLIIRRALSIQPKDDIIVEQREHIFHTRCHVKDKVINMSSEEEPQEVDMKMFIKAVNEQFRKLNTRLDNMQSLPISKTTRRRVLEEEEEDDSHLEESNSKQGKKVVSKRDSNLGSIKMKVPTFQGKNDPKLYLEWERKVEHVFDYHNCSEKKKVKLAAVEFIDYASIWWDQLVINRRKNGEKPIRSWEEMKLVMRKRFIPSHYYRDLHRKLQGLVQGYMSVDDYYKEMEIAMIRANIEEDREATLARFISGQQSYLKTKRRTRAKGFDRCF